METTINFEEFLNYIKNQEYYNNQISYIQHIPAKEAQFGTLTKPLKKRLQRWLDSNKISFGPFRSITLSILFFNSREGG